MKGILGEVATEVDARGFLPKTTISNEVLEFAPFDKASTSRVFL
jgi:hypothetical protein